MDMKALEILQTLSLLYVEDDAETREELAMMLEPWVSKLHVASDGQAGLDLFKTTRPDIVITDIQMPKMTGLAMSGEIRRLVPDQPIVVVSAYNDVEYLFRAIELGIDQYLTKPVHVERLLDKLAQMARVLVALRERRSNRVLLEQYKHLVDESAIVCKCDLAGLITYVNDTMCATTGFDRPALIGRQVADLRFDDEQRQRWTEVFIAAKAGVKWAGIVRNLSRSGTMVVVESSVVPIVNELGQVTEIVSLDVDITPVYQNYENLIEGLNHKSYSLNEQRHFLSEYKRALEMGACVCVTDPHFVIQSVNPQLEKLLGVTSETLRGRPLGQIAPDLPSEGCLTSIALADQGNYTHRIARFLRQDGQELQFSVGCIGVHNLAGALESIIIMCQDITESLRLARDITETQRELLYMLGDVVESRSQETADHVRRVSQTAKFLALKVGLSRDMADMIEAAAPMHDIGKVGVRDAILHKPGRLTPEEYDEMKHHARIGHTILGKVDRPLIALAAVIAREHHEHYDGQGYPFGLKGEAISMAGRIVAVADVLDALWSERVYKPAWEEQQVMDYFREQRGLQFDPTLVDLLLLNWDTIKALRSGASRI